MSQTALDARVQDGTGSCVSKRSSVLSEEVCEFLTDLPATHTKGSRFTPRKRTKTKLHQIFGICVGITRNAESKIKACLLAPLPDEPFVASPSQKHSAKQSLHLWCLAGPASFAPDSKWGVGIQCWFLWELSQLQLSGLERLEQLKRRFNLAVYIPCIYREAEALILQTLTHMPGKTWVLNNAPAYVVCCL